VQIIRFLDERNRVNFGHNYRDRTALGLDGGLLEGFRETGREYRVKKLLSPLQPPAILCNPSPIPAIRLSCPHPVWTQCRSILK
jgi:hypothetical protein